EDDEGDKVTNQNEMVASAGLKAVHEPLCDTTIAHPCLVPSHQGTTKEPRNGKSRRLPETTIFQDGPKNKALSSAGKREKLQEERDSETVDQEVRGSRRPSCTRRPPARDAAVLTSFVWPRSAPLP